MLTDLYTWEAQWQSDLDCKKETLTKRKARTRLKILEKLWRGKSISPQTKLSVPKTSIFSSISMLKKWLLTKDSDKNTDILKEMLEKDRANRMGLDDEWKTAQKWSQRET